MGVVTGSLTYVLLSTVFDGLASGELKKAAPDLRKLRTSLIHPLSNAGVVEVKEFDAGTISAVSTEEGEGVEAPRRQEQRPWWRRLFG
jgi:hypothetical protein